MSHWEDICDYSAVPPGKPIAVEVADEELVLVNLDGIVFALRNRCSHGHVRLSDGKIEGGMLKCPLHQGLVDVRTGAACGPPIVRPVPSFAVRVRNNRVEVAMGLRDSG